MRPTLRSTGLALFALVALACHKDATGPVLNSTLVVTPASLVLTVGDSLSVDAQLEGYDGSMSSPSALDWSSSDDAVADVSSGRYVVARSVGHATIVAASGRTKGYVSVTVAAAQSSFFVTPAAIALRPGATTALAGQVVNPDASVTAATGVTWSSTDPSVASVSSGGAVTAGAVGSATIVARWGVQVATVPVQVQSASVATVALTPDSVGLTLGETATIAAQMKDADGAVLANRVVTFASSNPSVATVSDAGLVTARAVGVVTITATSEGRYATATVSVSALPTASVTVTPGTLVIPRYESVQVVARVVDAGGNVTETPPGTIFYSTDESIARVSPAGIVTAISEGTAAISAQYQGQTGSTIVTVAQARVMSVTMNIATLSVHRFEPGSINATPRDLFGNALTGRAIVWTSSDPSIVSVDQTGRLTVNNEGTATIIAASEGRTGTTTVVVTPALTYDFAITPASPTIMEGDSLRIDAVPLDRFGNPIAGKTVLFSSSNPTAAPVDQDGLVRVRTASVGMAVITVRADSYSESITVILQAPPVASVQISPASLVVSRGSRVVLVASGHDTMGAAIPGAAFTWSSSNDSIATVDSAGVMQVGSGSTGIITITARATNGVTGSATITVTP